jgi:hypothetical protein
VKPVNVCGTCWQPRASCCCWKPSFDGEPVRPLPTVAQRAAELLGRRPINFSVSFSYPAKEAPTCP